MKSLGSSKSCAGKKRFVSMSPLPGLSFSQGSVLLSAWGRVRESCRDPPLLVPPTKGLLPPGKGTGESPPAIACLLVVTQPWGMARHHFRLAGSDFGLSGAFAPLWRCFPVPPALPPPPTRARSSSGEKAFNGKNKSKALIKATLLTPCSLPSPHPQSLSSCSLA